MAAVAREQGVTIDRIRQIKEKGLRRLRIGKAKRELLEKFDIVEAGAYRNSMNKFNEHYLEHANHRHRQPKGRCGL